MKLVKVLVFLLMLLVSSSAYAFDFSGTWTFLSNGNRGVLSISQSGNDITGTVTYPGYGSSSISGTVSDNKIVFTRSPYGQVFEGFISPFAGYGSALHMMEGIFSHDGTYGYYWSAIRQ